MKIKCEKFDGTFGFALVGAGYTAHQILRNSNLFKDDLKFVVDSNDSLYGYEFAESGILVSDFSSLKNFKGELIIACSGGLHLQQSLEMNSDTVLNYFYNYGANRDFYSPMLENKSELNHILSRFADSKSKAALNGLFTAIELGLYGNAYLATSPKPFFGPGNFVISKGERILDLGSYKGNHFSFLTLTDLQNIEKIVCIEPNSDNNYDLRNIFKNDSIKHHIWQEKMTIVNGACSDTPGFATNSQHTISNRIVHGLDPQKVNLDSVKIFTLDDFMDFEPTLITCDIEGDELRMLYGGRLLIKEFRPKMAISSYHEPGHLFDFIDFFDSLELPASFSFRLHDFGFMDQVLYVHFQD